MKALASRKLVVVDWHLLKPCYEGDIMEHIMIAKMFSNNFGIEATIFATMGYDDAAADFSRLQQFSQLVTSE